MKFKNIILITLLLLAVLTTSSVNAADNITDEGTLQDVPSEEIELNEDVTDEIVSSTPEDIISETDDGTFDALQQKISGTGENETVELENNYSYEGEGYNNNQIYISKSIIIDGKGHTIDAKSKSNIFHISAPYMTNITVIFKNITFINAFRGCIEGGNYHDAYYGSTCNIMYCNFTNIEAGSVSGTNISSCIFTNMKNGGVSGDNINSCAFINCSSGYEGLCTAKTIDSCKFINCSSSYGAIYTPYDSRITSCTFTNCMEGAIYVTVSSNSIITACNFTNCSSKRGGGAIYSSEIYKLNISSCIFTNCSASGYGGAIYLADSRKCNILLSNFTDCSASSDGGAIYNSIEYGNCSIDQCTFARCRASIGGAIYNVGENFALSNSLFINNTADSDPDRYSEYPINFSNNTYIGTDTVDKISNTTTPATTPTNTQTPNTQTPNTQTPNTQTTITNNDNTIKLTLKTVKVKKSAKKLVLQSTLKINGKKVKGKTVTFKFNGKTYKAKTNKKGIAKVTIKKNILKKLKSGKKITYQASYGKTTVKKSVKVQK